jgi:hypothetical protein
MKRALLSGYQRATIMEKYKVYLEGSTRMSLIVSHNDSSGSGRNEVGSAFEMQFLLISLRTTFIDREWMLPGLINSQYSRLITKAQSPLN